MSLSAEVATVIVALIGLFGLYIKEKMAHNKTKRDFKREKFDEIHDLSVRIHKSVFELSLAERYQHNADEIVFYTQDDTSYYDNEFVRLGNLILEDTEKLEKAVNMYIPELKKATKEFIENCHTIAAVKEDTHSQLINKIFEENLNEIDVGRRYLELHEKEPLLNQKVVEAKNEYLKELNRKAGRNFK